MALALVLVFAVAVGGVVAWLTAKTDPVTNTFTVGDINITLAESDNLDLKMVPGNTITKDPKVTVEANSEACWLFVQVKESNNFGTYMTYSIDSEKWQQLTDKDGNAVAGVYYCKVDATAASAGVTYPVLAGDKVTVNQEVTKAMLENAKTDQPELTFKAFAVQIDNIADAFAAWGTIPAADKL